MNNQKGFSNIVLIGIIVVLVGAVGCKSAQQTRVVKPEANEQLPNEVPNSDNSPQASKISENIFNNATYILPCYAGENGVADDAPKEFKMIDGLARVGEFTRCGINESKAAIDQVGNVGVVPVYCRYGASLADVFLVAFKNLNSTPVQTDVVDLRKHSVLLSRNLFRVSVEQMSLEPSGLLTVTALVVPEALRDAPGYYQSATEPVAISYHLGNYGRLTE